MADRQLPGIGEQLFSAVKNARSHWGALRRPNRATALARALAGAGRYPGTAVAAGLLNPSQSR
jgi:hypothetical protein